MRSGSIALAGVAALFFCAPPSLAQFPPDTFDEVKQTVVEFEAGIRGDIFAAECITASSNSLSCPGKYGQENIEISNSGTKIKEACYVIFDENELSVAFHMVGVVGDRDGNGDPNSGSVIGGVSVPDDPVIANRDLYSVELDENFPPDSVEYTFNLPRTNVGDYTPQDFPGHATSNGRLCLIRAAGVDSPIAGPAGSGGSRCVDSQDLGMYSAGTTGLAIQAPPESGKDVSREVVYFVDNLANLPGVRGSSGVFPKFIRVRTGSGADTCQEDSVGFRVAPPSCVEVEKNAGAECRGDGAAGQERASFHATFRVTNCGAADLDEVVIKDTVHEPVRLSAPICRLDGHRDFLPVDDLGGGSFRASLGPLRSSDTGGLLLDCEWPAISFRGEEELAFDNSVKVTATAGGRTPTDKDRDDAVALKSRCEMGPVLEMLMEHDGVGFDNALALTRSLSLPPPLGDRFQFGSGVDPNGLNDVDPAEDFLAEGAAPVAGRPGVFQTIPRVIGQGLLRPGSRARFTWTILVSKGVPDDFAGLGVKCSLCAELAQKSAPAATFSNLSTFGRRGHIPDLILGNRPLNIRVTQIGREPQHLRRFESALDARTIPGLEQRILRENGEIAILGCKPTAVLIDPFSNNEPLLKDDLIVIRIDVPETERARLFADPTSCEISYLSARPSR
ncbi:MAG: hypothetical protein V3T01_06475 [Myxococcota bacterium]